MTTEIGGSPDLEVKHGLRDTDENATASHEPRPISATPADDPVPSVGLWQCLAPKGCEDAQKREPFPGPLQSAAKEQGVPIACPTCGNVNVIYAGDAPAKKAQEV